MAETIRINDIGIIMLAAGSSQRFTDDKRQARFKDGRTLLETSLSSVPPDFKNKILVLRPGDEQLAEKFSHTGWQIVIAENASKGMAYSLSTGIQWAMDWEGVIIGLGDMPLVNPGTYTKLQYALTTNEIVIPVYEGRHGNPVGFRQKYFASITELSGDKGARSLLNRYQSQCFECECNDSGILRDIDTPEELLLLHQVLQQDPETL